MSRWIRHVGLMSLASALGFAAARWTAPVPAPVPAVSGLEAEPPPAPRARAELVPATLPETVRADVAASPARGRTPEPEEARRPAVLTRLLSPSSVRHALGDPDPVRRHLAFAEILRGVTAQNARSIAEAIRGVEARGQNRQEFALVMEAWGQADGPAAIAFSQDLNDEQAVTSALSGWASRYPEAAREWAMKRDANPDNPWMIPVIAGASRENLGRAVEMLYALPYGAARGRSLDFVVDAYSRQGLETLINWAERIPDERLRQGTAVRVAARMAEQDPRRAADWALAHATDAERQVQAVLPAVMQWARQTPREAVEWSDKLEPGRTRDIALEHTVGAWAWKEPAEAEAWLSRTAPGPTFDRARISIGMRYFESDPVRAMSWVSTVSDEHLRNRMLERIAGAWTERDPAAADKFLNK